MSPQQDSSHFQHHSSFVSVAFPASPRQQDCISPLENIQNIYNLIYLI